jgi:hypothetical protein
MNSAINISGQFGRRRVVRASTDTSSLPGVVVVTSEHATVALD